MISIFKESNRILKLISKISNHLLSGIEKKLIKEYEKKEIKCPPIFIIGAPRTGSTILYEYITNYLDVSYINNFMAYFYKDLYIFALISERIFGNEQHNCFDSKHGDTYGWNAPHECGVFWYRWLPRDKHFIDFDETENESKKEIYATITAITNEFNKPMVFKNLNAGQRLRLIKEILPGSLFIYIKRDPLYVAQSIIRGRERIYDDRSQWWSIMPKEYEQLLKLDYPEQVVKQIYYLQQQIEKDIELFPESSHITIYYENFCNNPKKTINYIVKELIKKNGYKVDYKSAVKEDKLKPSKERKIDKETFDKLKEIIEKLEW